MPFTTKEIKLADFMARLHERIKRGGNANALIFFQIFLQKALPDALRQVASASWDGQTLLAGDFDALYPMAVKILHDAATRNFSEAHQKIYEEAHAVSVAFCEEINEFFECSGEEVFDLIPVKSYSQILVERGLAKLSTDTER